MKLARLGHACVSPIGYRRAGDAPLGTAQIGLARVKFNSAPVYGARKFFFWVEKSESDEFAGQAAR